MPVLLTPKGARGTGFRYVPAVRPAHAHPGQAASTADDHRREEGVSDSRLIVASNAGAASHPAWYVNLARRPEGAAIEVDGRRFAVNADSLHGPERDRAWKRIVALAPGYGKYERDTDREIPVVRVTRRP
ncbi:MAG TPA: nitroreductase/quinone reductase family protein [Candidatus Limnocylindria bacterium]